MDISTSSVRYGFILAAFSILLSLVTYLLDISSTGYLIGILSLVGSIFIMYFAGHTEKNKLGGFISWKQALKAIWICGMIGFSLGTVYQIVFMKYIDHSVLEEQKEMKIKMIENFRGSMGDEAAEKQIELIQSEDMLSLKNISIMLASAIIASFIISALLALIVRRENPQALFDKY